MRLRFALLFALLYIFLVVLPLVALVLAEEQISIGLARLVSREIAASASAVQAQGDYVLEACKDAVDAVTAILEFVFTTLLIIVLFVTLAWLVHLVLAVRPATK